MKVEKLMFNNHNVLKRLEVDFIDEFNKPLDTIVIIGDNGVGKTKLLEAIIAILRGERDELLGKIGSVKLSCESITLVVNIPDAFTIPTSNGKITLKTPRIIWLPAEMKAKREFETDDPAPIEIINQDYERLAKRIAAYISDIIDEAVYKNIDQPPRDVINKKCQEINDVFQILNLDIKLVGLSPNEKSPLFINAWGEEFNIEALSSGEKQLFLRILSLKQLNVNNGIILIDEPETSLHPEWQRKIIDIYKSIGDNNQLIIATHSPFIVGSVKSESVRIMSKDDEGKIKISKQDEISETYGKSVEDILKVTMDLDSLRNEEVTIKLNRVTQLLNSNQYETEEYKHLMDELKNQLGTADKDIMRIEMEKSVRVRENAKSD